MDTSENGRTPGRRRRTHSAEFKTQVVAACHAPGVSVAAIALAHRINANRVRKWIVQHRAGRLYPSTAVVPAHAGLTLASKLQQLVEVVHVAAVRVVRVMNERLDDRHLAPRLRRCLRIIAHLARGEVGGHHGVDAHGTEEAADGVVYSDTFKLS